MRIFLLTWMIFFWSVGGVFLTRQRCDAFPDMEEADERVVTHGFESCLQASLENNHKRPVSRQALEMAEAQHRQALAGYWPRISLTGGYQHMDESPNFLFPASTISIGGDSLPIPGMAPLPLINIPVPAQDVKLQDPDSFQTSLQLQWLLYDGGMRKGCREQAMGQVDMLKEEVRRTDLEITDTVTRYYYGAILAIRMNQLARETMSRLEATLSVTETLYQGGGGTIKKTEWLDNKVTVGGVRILTSQMEKNQAMAQAALANTMGLPWSSSVRPLDDEIPYTPLTADLKELVATAYSFNPDWNKIDAGLRALEGALKTAKSDHFPKLVLFGNISRWWNDHSSGVATDENKETWQVGVGVEIPVFSGFLTQNKIAEARARLSMLKAQRFLLEEGMALQIKNIFLDLNASGKAYEASKEAWSAAQENCALNIRAYRNELVETDKVIRAQLMEALMAAQYHKSRYDYVALKSKLNLLVGTELLKKMEAR